MQNENVLSIKEKISPALRRYGVIKAAIFGSLARGESGYGSDIDILVQFEGSKSLLDLAGLKIELEELLGRKVDVITYNSLHHLIRGRILAEQEAIL